MYNAVRRYFGAAMLLSAGKAEKPCKGPGASFATRVGIIRSAHIHTLIRDVICGWESRKYHSVSICLPRSIISIPARRWAPTSSPTAPPFASGRRMRAPCTCIGDFNGRQRDDASLLTRDEHGHWRGFIPGVRDRDRYMFYVVGEGSEGPKRDPYARELQTPFPERLHRARARFSVARDRLSSRRGFTIS